MEGWTKSLRSVLVEIYVLLPTNGNDEPRHSWVPLSKFKSSYLWVEGRTKPPASTLVKNLSPPIYGRKYESSHLRVPRSKFKGLPIGGRTNQATSKCLGTKYKSFYLGWKDETSHLRVPRSKFKGLPTGGRTNEATSKCLGTKYKSFYLWVEVRTMSLTGALIEV